MKNIGRLRVGSVLLGGLALSGGMGLAQGRAAVPSKASVSLAQAKVFPFGQMPVKIMANGGESRGIVEGVLATGESVALHESMQPVGSVPNPAHRIEHSEFIVVQDGTLEFDHDGKSEAVGAGGIIYVAFGTLHQVKNVGDVPAKYVVIAIGGDTGAVSRGVSRK
jgi:mannose-6-phosphate isomerase-like protein (cupin superfamily)